MSSHLLRRPWLLVLLAASLALTGASCVAQERSRTAVPVAPTAQAPAAPVVSVPAVPEVVPQAVPTAPAIPTAAVPHRITVLPVPFTVQAPHANWELPYQEACEEASMIMVDDFFVGRTDMRLPPDEVDRRIIELVAWEAAHGYTIDITAAEVARVLGERFDLVAEVVPYDAVQLRAELTARHPVILPAAGRLLGNPYFHQPGPLYHMLVVKGYEGDEFITNDPGTKRGENFRYYELALAHAVHDWNSGAVTEGEPVMVVVRGKRTE